MKERKFQRILTPDSELTPEQLAARVKHRRTIRTVSIAALLLAMAGLTYMLYPLFRGFGQENWAEMVKERIDSHGTLGGIVIYLSIQALQVPIAIIPAIQVVGGVLYGWLIGTLLSYVGICLGTLVVWQLVKWIGEPLVEAFFTEKSLRKFGFLEDEHRLTLILIALELMPGIPKDLIAYLVPLTKIDRRSFFLYVLPFRIPSILLTSAFGSSITKGNYVHAVIFCAVIALIAVIGYLFKNKLLGFLNNRKTGNSNKSTK